LLYVVAGAQRFAYAVALGERYGFVVVVDLRNNRFVPESVYYVDFVLCFADLQVIHTIPIRCYLASPYR
jgi:hypothetical protein